jgi:hypothetical protein
MIKMHKTTITIVALLISIGVHASGNPPGVITEFCAKKFGGDIAGVNQPFNATDVVEKGIPARRILGYFVTSTTSYLWYEHGGRGYHQHLVSFNSAKPEEVKASYVFVDTKHKNIESLIKDTEFLRSHVAKNGEL